MAWSEWKKFNSEPTEIEIIDFANALLTEIRQSKYATNNASFNAIIGKTYLVDYNRNGGQGATISSGATILTQIPYPITTQFTAIVKATSTTITTMGSGNTVYYKQLD